MYRIVLLSEAKKSYKWLFTHNKPLFQRIYNVLEALKTNPLLGKALRDNLKGKYSIRIGVYRIIYFIDKQNIIVYVLDIAHRREVYR